MITAMIGPPRDPSECEAYAAMCIDAFGLPPLARHDWLTRIDPANVRLTRDGDRVTGGLSLLPMGMWIGGKRVSITIVHLVVVAPADRKRGIGRALVGAALDELHRSGTALSVLYAATEDIYRHLGYEEAGSCVRYRVRLDQLTEAIAECDVGVIPNKRSIFTEINTPTRIFEYLALGKPVVAPRAPGIQDYFTENSLVYFNLGEADDLARKLIWVAHNQKEALEVTSRGQAVYLEHAWSEESEELLRRTADLLIDGDRA